MCFSNSLLKLFLSVVALICDFVSTILSKWIEIFVSFQLYKLVLFLTCMDISLQVESIKELLIVATTYL